MTDSVLISGGSGTGSLQSEIAVASCVRLLQRGMFLDLKVVSTDIEKSKRHHPELEFVAQDDYIATLSDYKLVVIVGDLRDPSRYQAAVRLVSQAKIQGTAVALVSILLAPEAFESVDHSSMMLLGNCESVSVADSKTAELLSSMTHRRFAVTAPIELILRARRVREATTLRIGIASELVQETNPARELLPKIRAFARRVSGKVLIVETSDTPVRPGADSAECIAFEEWFHTWNEITSCHVWIDAADTCASIVAAANGVSPIAVGQRSPLLERLGLSNLHISTETDSVELFKILNRARGLEGDDMRQRTSPLRTVAWRALGTLCDTRKPRKDSATPWNRESARALGLALFEYLHPRVQKGQDCRQELECWKPTLGDDPRWMELQAKSQMQLGFDSSALEVLERAVRLHPSDTVCWALLAMTAWRCGDQQRASYSWNHVQQLDPQSVQAPYQLGCSSLFEGHWEKAMTSLQRAMELAPERSDIAVAIEDTRESLQAGHLT